MSDLSRQTARPTQDHESARGVVPTWARQRQFAVGAVLFAFVAGMCVVNPAFGASNNLRDLLVQSAPAVIVGCGMTLVIMAGEIDISVGSLLGFLAAGMGILSSPSHAALPSWLVIVITLGLGTCAGCVNGLLVTAGKVPSIVATLGMLTVLRGVTELVLAGSWITDLPLSIREFGTGTAGGLPYCVWAAAAVACCVLVVLLRTPLGLQVRAIGGNPLAAALARVSVGRVKLLTFAITGLLTGVAAVLCVPQQSVIESGIGIGFELVVVTAVVVGGTSVRGGAGGIVGTVLAALLLGSIRTGLIFLKLGEAAIFWERAIQGAFILAAVLADHVAAHAGRRDVRRIGAGV